MIPGLDSLTGGGSLDLGNAGASSAQGGHAGTSSGNKVFTFNNAGGTSGLDIKTIGIVAAVAMGGLILWKKL